MIKFYKRDGVTFDKNSLPKDLESIGVNITKDGTVELRVNRKVKARIKITEKDNGGAEGIRMSQSSC